MKNSRFVRISALLFFILIAGCTSRPKEVKDMSEEELVEYARGIHERVITLDTHNDIDVENFTKEKNYTMDLDTQVNLPKMDSGGMDVSWMIVYTGQGDLDEEGFARASRSTVQRDTCSWCTRGI